MSDQRRPFDRPWADRLPGSGFPPQDGSPPPEPAGEAPAQGAGPEASPDGGGEHPDGGEATTADPAGPADGGAQAGEAPWSAPPDDEAVVAEVVESGPASDTDTDALVAEAEAAISQDLSALSAERDEYLESLRRLQADFENYKKRMLRQQTSTLERAGEDLVTKLLPVLDTIDLARRHGAGEAVEQVASALLDVLAKEGLERIDPAGTPFDPNEHEAVAHEEGEGDPEVIDVMRAGYRWRGRLLRPAMVTVKG